MRKGQSNSGTHITRMRNTKGRKRTPRTDNWPVNKEMIIKKHYKALAKFTKELDKIKEINS